MSCLLELRLAGGLIQVARAMRVLKRYSIHEPQVSLTREGVQDVAVVHGRLDDASHSLRLAGALARIPGVVEAVISGDGGFNVQLNR